MNATCAFGEEGACRKPYLPLQCPVIQPKEIIYQWFVYEDLVYYSSRGDSWKDYFTIWGMDQFPSHDPPPVMNEVPADKVVTINMGEMSNSITLEGEQLTNFLKLVSVMNKQQTADNKEELEQVMKEKTELFKILGFKQRSIFKPSPQKDQPDVIDEDGYATSSYMFATNKEMVIRRKDGVKYDVVYDGVRINLNTITPDLLIATMVKDGQTTVVHVKKIGEDTQSVECSLQVGEQRVPCVLLHTRLNDVREGLETWLSEGVVQSVSEKVVLLNDGGNQLHFQRVSPSFEWNELLTDKFYLVDSEMDKTWKNKQFRISLHLQNNNYPRIQWYGKHILIETGSFTVGIIDGKVKKNHLLINASEDVSSILLSFREIDEGNI